jgi:hypothetical protein
MKRRYLVFSSPYRVALLLYIRSNNYCVNVFVPSVLPDCLPAWSFDGADIALELFQNPRR